MNVFRAVLVALTAASCAETAVPKPETPKAPEEPVARWDDAATRELEAYTTAEYTKWLSGDAASVKAGIAADTALVYDTDPNNTPVRIVGPERIRKYAETMSNFAKESGLKANIDSNQCRATAHAGVCATEFHVDVATPDGQSLSMKQRGTCIAAKGDGGWRWAHCHVSPAEWPKMPDLGLESQNMNEEDLEWNETPGGFEMAVTWQNPLTGGIVGFARFPAEWSDQEAHFHSSSMLLTVVKGKMTHWSEDGTKYEVGPGGFQFIPGGRAGAHKSAFDKDTVVFAVMDKPFDRVSAAEADAASAAAPPAGAPPWDPSLAAAIEAFARGQMANWEAMDVDQISATVADVGLPSFDLGMEGEPVRMATSDDQIAYARAMKDSGATAKMTIKDVYCRSTQTFGWCAMDFDMEMPGSDGKPTTLNFRGTGVGAKQTDGWKTVHWHGSMAKFPGPPPGGMAAVKAADLKWTELPGTGGVKLAQVWEDPTTKGIAGFVQMPKVWKGIRNHFHSANIHYTVLNGKHAHIDPSGDRRDTTVGGWGLEVGKNIHRTEGKGGLRMFIVTDGPFDAVMVDKDGNPLPPPPEKGAKGAKKDE